MYDEILAQRPEVTDKETSKAQSSTAAKPRASFTSISPYYQSRTYVAKCGINPLAASAAPLFTLMIKLQKTGTQSKKDEFFQLLVHEMRAFESAAYGHSYRAQTILIARYILCAAIDEAIQFSHWGQNNNWQENNLLFAFQQEPNNKNKFFSILDRLCEEPQPYTDLLELMYLCLSLGYEGPYRHQTRGHIELAAITDRLYHIIRKQRGEFRRSLLVKPISKSKPKLTTQPLSMWQIIAVTGVIVFSLLAGFNFVLNSNTAPLENSLHRIVLPNSE